MFDVDKIINEHNKTMLYGDKPELPEKIGKKCLYNNDGSIYGKIEPSISEITEAINKIIEYLEWQDK